MRVCVNCVCLLLRFLSSENYKVLLILLLLEYCFKKLLLLFTQVVFFQTTFTFTQVVLRAITFTFTQVPNKVTRLNANEDMWSTNTGDAKIEEGQIEDF